MPAQKRPSARYPLQVRTPKELLCGFAPLSLGEGLGVRVAFGLSTTIAFAKCRSTNKIRSITTSTRHTYNKNTMS